MADLKRNSITLVTDVKEGEVVTKTYRTPPFIPLTVVYQAIDLIAKFQKGDSNEREQIEELAEFVSGDIYKDQFTKEELENGLHAPDAMSTLTDQLVFVAQGKETGTEKKVDGEELLNDEDFTWAKQKEYLDKFIINMVENGKDINEVLNMPYDFVLQLMLEKNKPRYTESLIAAFGG